MASSGLAIQNRSVFRQAFEIPVRCINGSMKPQGAFVGATVIRSMRVSLEVIVQYASRYIYVQSGGGVAPSTRFARDWKEILRWEVDKFWFVDLSSSQPKIETLFQSKKSFSSEHGRRSGEYLAYGFALAFIDRLLNIHPQRVMFFAASGTRADFHLPIILPDGSRAGLEARSRGYFREPPAKEIMAIIGKKKPTTAPRHPGSGLVVYFLHGVKIIETKDYGTQNQTQLLLVDPVDEGGTVSDLETQATALKNYLQLTERIGLHFDTNILKSALYTYKVSGEFRAQPEPHEPDFERTFSSRHPIRREFGGKMFVGRFFSSLVAEGISPQQAHARMDAGDFGTYSFEGLAIDVLRRIALHDWAGLATYSHFGDEFHSDITALEERAIVSGDGFCSDDIDLDESYVREVNDVRSSFLA